MLYTKKEEKEFFSYCLRVSNCAWNTCHANYLAHQQFKLLYTNIGYYNDGVSELQIVKKEINMSQDSEKRLICILKKEGLTDEQIREHLKHSSFKDDSRINLKKILRLNY